ncbi:hypothetical protein C2W62_12300 [Candidatus Entotheonella serta]|nr:hypothetical protein C2W62_12300 [Candidatus Entotheonella serta]
MHDGIHVEKAGTPAVTICTDIFIETSHAMAAMWGAPAFPIIFTQHPIAYLTAEQLQERAEEMIDQIEAILLGRTVSQPAVTA